MLPAVVGVRRRGLIAPAGSGYLADKVTRRLTDLGDLWEYSGGQWTWIKGPDSVSQPGTYGLAPAQVDYPHVVNYPGTRAFPAYWVDLNGYFWMMGGEGYDSTTTSGGIGMLNNLWRYLPYP